MSAPTVQALDLSFSRAHYPWWRARRADGYQLAVQCLWTGATTPAVANANLQDAADAGLAIAGYATPIGLGAITALHAAKAAAADLWPRLAFLATDAEEDPETGQPLAPLFAIHDLTAATRRAGATPILYSRRSYWLAAYGDVPADAPVWTAEYNSGPRLDIIRYPWGQAPTIGKQHTANVTIDGVTVDLNTFDAAYLGLAKEEPMEIVIFHGKGRDAHFVLTPDGRKTHILNPAHLKALLTRGIVRGNKSEEWSPATVDAIPDAAGSTGITR